MAEEMLPVWVGMAFLRRRPLTFTLLVTLGCSSILAAACGDDPANDLDGRRAVKTTDGDAAAGGADPNKVSPEEAKFRIAEPELQKSCGKTCHDTGTYIPPAPTFLAPPDIYKAIKAQPGIVVRDVYASALLTKGPHAGPALSQDPELEKKVVDWLEAEAVLIQSQKLPTTPAFTVVSGPNDIDLSPASVGGLTGVHLKFEAVLLGTMLSLTKLTLVAPAGQDVHVLQPRFIRVLPKAKEDGSIDVPDPADSFSNADQTIPNGKETPLAPGSVLFSSASWRPFDLAADKLRIEITKLEPGKISVVAAAATCKDAAAFGTAVLNGIRNQGTSQNRNCQGCHADGLGGLSLGSQDVGLICQQVLSKLNKANLAQSLIVTKVTGGMAHNGGTVPDANAWRALFVNNAGVFF
jgi:hypothetical protein